MLEINKKYYIILYDIAVSTYMVEWIERSIWLYVSSGAVSPLIWWSGLKGLEHASLYRQLPVSTYMVEWIERSE